jgi:TPP-dependent pyruvate/acetoin dehydrogenase alpha subunit
MAGRFAAFDIPIWERETSDVLEVRDAAREAHGLVCSGIKPAGLILHTHRFSAHSKGDDLRSPEELTRIRKFDPLLIHGLRLTVEHRAKAESEVNRIVDDAFRRAELDPFPSIGGSV